MDINNVKCKLEKGLKVLDFLDNNINCLSNWLTEVEEKLYAYESSQSSEKSSEAQLKYITVRFLVIQPN